MEPDIYAIIRRSMQIAQDCQEAYEWDFAETYRRVCRHMEDSQHKGGVAKTYDYLSELDPCELTDYELPYEG